MRKRTRKKKIKFHPCSECGKQFDIDELKIHWKQYRLLCKACDGALSEIVHDKIIKNEPK